MGYSGLQRLSQAAAIGLLLTAAGAGVAYLLAPYAVLRNWYLGLTPHMYRAAAWPTAFFTPAVKMQGNWLVLVALAGLLGTALAHWRWPQPVLPAPRHRWGRADAPWLALLLVLAASLWGWGAVQMLPAYDEVFSAVYCAGSGSVLVAGSYYMLPNNHVLFNVLNGALFGPWLAAPGLLWAGRGLSGLAYAGTLVVVYRLGAGWAGRRWAGAGLAGLAAVQFSLWGFGIQARGYALYALLHWVALAGALAYWRQPRRRAALRVQAGAVALGYVAVPTFLFFHAALLLVGAVEQVRQRRVDGLFWRFQAGSVGLAGLLYGPLLGFSGLAALTANAYVRPAAEGWGAFVVGAWPVLRTYATYCFGEVGWGPWPAYGLALLPLALLAARPHRRLGLVYLAWVLVLLAATLGLRRVVFHRNALALFSLALVLGPLAVGVWLGRWRRWAGIAGALLLGTALAVNFAWHNPVQQAANLYFYDLPGSYQAARQRLDKLPAGASVTFSEGSFYPYWLYLQAGGQAPHPAQPPRQATDYYLTTPSEALPPALAPHYLPQDTVAEYCLWRRVDAGW